MRLSGQSFLIVCLVVCRLSSVEGWNESQAASEMSVLIESLDSENNNNRWQTCRRLARLGPSAAEAVPALVERLEDSNLSIRPAAVEALGEICRGHYGSLWYLEDELDNDFTPLASKVVSRSAVPALVKVLEDTSVDDYYLRYDAAKALALIGPRAEKAIPALVSALKKTPAGDFETSSAGFASARALMHMRNDGLPALRRVLGVNNHSAQWYVLAALDELGPHAKAAARDVAPLLKSTNRQVREQAVRTLYRICIKWPDCDPVTGDVDPDAPSVSVVVDKEVLQKVVRALTESLQDRSPYVRRFATYTLTFFKLRAKPAIESLIGILGDDSMPFGNESGPCPSNGFQASLTLAAIGSDAVDPLIAAIEDRNQPRRDLACYALELLGPAAKTAIPALSRLQQDPDTRLRKAAASALKQIRD